MTLRVYPLFSVTRVLLFCFILRICLPFSIAFVLHVEPSSAIVLYRPLHVHSFVVSFSSLSSIASTSPTEDPVSGTNNMGTKTAQRALLKTSFHICKYVVRFAFGCLHWNSHQFPFRAMEFLVLTVVMRVGIRQSAFSRMNGATRVVRAHVATLSSRRRTRLMWIVQEK